MRNPGIILKQGSRSMNEDPYLDSKTIHYTFSTTLEIAALFTTIDRSVSLSLYLNSYRYRDKSKSKCLDLSKLGAHLLVRFPCSNAYYNETFTFNAVRSTCPTLRQRYHRTFQLCVAIRARNFGWMIETKLSLDRRELPRIRIILDRIVL